MSQYAQEIKYMLASLNESEDGNERILPDEEELETIHIYPVAGGGILLTKEELAPDEPEAPILDSQEPDTHPRPAKDPPYFLHFLLILFLFIGLDSADTALTTWLTPTVTITVIPQERSITLQSSAQLGKLLAPLTVSESQIAPATGKGHQDARSATGTLTFYNAAFSAQTVEAGTVLTASDGIQVVTDAAIAVPANAPPSDGQASVAAHAVSPGASGNMQALAINGSFTSSLYVKNLAPLTGGQDERDFRVVTKDDIATAAATLKNKVTASMNAALQGQLPPAQQLQIMPCIPTTTADHRAGDEATQVQVTVSETCTAIAYNTQELTSQATQQLTVQAAKNAGKGYRLSGNVQVTITKATTQHRTVVLSFTCQGTWVYQINESQIKALVSGKPRLDALHLLALLSGVRHVTIGGITDNTLLPEDTTHIHLLIIYTAL